MVFLCDTDFVLTSSWTFREATTEEEIAQDLEHLLEEDGDLGDPMDPSFSAAVRSAVIDLLSTHPKVTSIDGINVTPASDGGNYVSIDVYVNGNPLAIQVTKTGG